MISAEELAAIPVFALLEPAVRAELARAGADIHLEPGEFLAHEGEAPAFIAVLSGKLEVVKLIDGVERIIGTRTPGRLFGEVSVIYGTPQQAGVRASESTRVIRLEVRQYYSAAAACPEFAKAVGALASERIGGLQSLTAEARHRQATLVGSKWDPATLELRRFLARNLIVFDALEPDDAQLAKHWNGPLPVVDDCPALQLSDGINLKRPRPRTVAECLGLPTVPEHSAYDTLVIGAGPAGLAAAVYGASEGLKTLVVETEAPGGQAGTSSRIENYLGFPSGVSGDELASRALRQARRLGAEILVARKVLGIDPAANTVQLDDNEQVRARTIIIATGVSWRRLDVEGFDNLVGRGVYYGAARSEADTTLGQDIHLVGAGNSAGQAAMFFANYARSVTLLVRGASLEDAMSQYLVEQLRRKSNIHVMLRTEIKAVHGSTHLTGLDVVNRDSKAVTHLASGGLFVFIGANAETEWLPAAIKRNDRGYILTGTELMKAGGWSGTREPMMLETSAPGIFACGDVRLSPVKRVASAVGEGSMAIAFVHQYLAYQA